MTFHLSLSESAGARLLHRLVELKPPGNLSSSMGIVKPNNISSSRKSKKFLGRSHCGLVQPWIVCRLRRTRILNSLGGLPR